ncbi:MAG: hypothetical protein R2726_04450 [Acidimicrobiales bacterium]
MTAPSPTPPTSPPPPTGSGRGRRPSPTFAVFKLLLRLQLTFPRLATMVVLGALFVVVAAAIAAGRRGSALRNATNFVSNVGFVVLVPVASLVFSSSSLGDTVDDQTLVYLWLRPIARWRLTLAAMASSLVIVWPLVLIPLVLGAELAGGNADLVVATALATTVGVFAYVGVFTALGLRVRNALLWGLLYVFIWEGFVAGASDTAARAAIRAYLRSQLAEATGVQLRLGAISTPWTWLTPILVGLAGAAATTRWLRRRDVP